MSEPIRITRAATKKPKPKDRDLTFGTVFTDHLFVMDFQEAKGWYDPRIEPYGALSLDPAAAVLHYAQAVFDGLKAFRGRDGRVRLFRPQKHVERLNHSARRMCIPPLDPELALKALVELVGLERDWVPSTVGTSLYIRPTIIANEPFLGAHAHARVGAPRLRAPDLDRRGRARRARWVAPGGVGHRDGRRHLARRGTQPRGRAYRHQRREDR